MSETGRLAAQLSAIDKTPLIVGIDGLGGAGKSTLSESLAAALAAQGRPVTLLHIDDFIHQRAVRYRDDVPAWRCYYELQWNYAPLLELIAAFRHDGTYCGEVSLYNKDKDSYDTQEICIPKDSVLLVEGVFLQRPELSGVFDVVIYLDVPESVRLSRVLLRDGYIGDREAIMEKYEQRYFPAERHYVESCQPAETADVVMKETE
ncbi:MAG: uridine kinase [Ruminococcus sp.]|nr:uridine kinase [Ruminococcus sp.]